MSQLSDSNEIPTITDLYHKEELLRKIGSILENVTLSDGRKPLIHIREAAFKSRQNLHNSEIIIQCELDRTFFDVKFILLMCMREIQFDGKSERLVYKDWRIKIPENLSNRNAISWRELTKQLNELNFSYR